MATISTSMTVGEFRQLIHDMTHQRMGLKEFCAFLQHETKEDKFFREEYLAVLATIDFKRIGNDEIIELGNEMGDSDAKVANAHVFEIVQALPKDEHALRFELAKGSTSPHTYFKHAADHQQFPQAIIEAIELKHKKRYSDCRSLIVVFDGDYSFEDDRVVATWIDAARTATTRGTFKEILLFERARQKIFTVFNSDEEA